MLKAAHAAARGGVLCAQSPSFLGTGDLDGVPVVLHHEGAPEGCLVAIAPLPLPSMRSVFTPSSFRLRAIIDSFPSFPLQLGLALSSRSFSGPGPWFAIPFCFPLSPHPHFVLERPFRDFLAMAALAQSQEAGVFGGSAVSDFWFGKGPVTFPGIFALRSSDFTALLIAFPEFLFLFSFPVDPG